MRREVSERRAGGGGPGPGERRRAERSILLVEDNEDDRILARLALGRSGPPGEFAIVSDGAEALEFLFGTGRYAQNPPERPGLILLDLKLPKVCGLEVLRRLRAEKRTRYIPVVVLTSSREERDVARCYGSGANSFVRKPINFDQFTRLVEQLKGYWLSVNEAL